MDSDSSLEGEERNNGASSRSWANKQNSDVSDDENFSRGAKSIESPPESPPRGGGNLDSPPASPAQGIASPGQQSFESQSVSGGSSPFRGSPRPPESPSSNYETNHKSPGFGSIEWRSPHSVRENDYENDYENDSENESRRDRRRRTSADYPRSPDKSSKSSSPAHAYSKSSSPEQKSPHGPRSPEAPPVDDGNASDSNSSHDDGRSNISSNSSIGSAESRSSSKAEDKKKTEKVEIKSHGEDLSDVSDIESLGSMSDNEGSPPKKEETKKDEVQKGEKDKKIGLNLAEETEQLDFEAEEEREEGECEGAKPAAGGVVKEGMGAKDTGSGGDGANGGAAGGTTAGSNGTNNDEDDGEIKELEEGELSDEGDNRPEETEPRPVCRFFSRGQCTWGSSCRFVHPGVTDKGNYTMFDMVRPLVPTNNGPPPHLYAGPIGPMDFHRMDRGLMGPPPYAQPLMRKEEPVGESAWERGLRQAKELLRKSSKRKETEVDFEEKKLNLSIAQDEFDKENDYYTRSGSPYADDHYDKYAYKSDGKRYRSVSDRFGDYGPPASVPSYYGPGRDGWHYDERSAHYPRHHQSDYHHTRGGSSSVPPDDYYDRKRHKYPSREVIVQRMDKSSWKEESPRRSGRGHSERGGGGSGRGDEWSDPWMRSKSPSRKTSSRSRKKSYSSQSSYSSSSSSRSSSYSSYSRSRSGSRSTRSTRSRSRSTARKKPSSPLSRRTNRSPFSRGKVSPTYISEKRAETERSLHMNPPPPSPRGNPSSPSSRRNPTPPSTSERTKGLSARLLAAAMRDRSGSKSSRSSSGSDSSGSSSDSSSDSVSSSSSSRLASSPVNRPPPRIASSSSSRGKRIVLDEKLAQAMKVKAMDALKLSGQKQQIKLTLKGRDGATERLQLPPMSGRKRPAESPPFEEDSSVISKTAKKPAPSRREELLKQLKAVEDAIARKRSKV